MSWTHSKVTAAIGFVGFFVLASGSATQGCATTTPPEPADDARSDSAIADTTADSATDSGALDTGADADATDGRLDGGNFEAGSPPDAGPLPEVGCAVDAAATDADGGEVCPLPRATCVGNWIVSYVSSVCVDGACTFVRVLKDCAEEGGSFCSLTSDGATCRFATGGK